MQFDSIISRQIVAGPPSEVFAVPAPSTPNLDPPFAVRPVEPAGDDAALVTEWMSLPHMVETWERSDWSVERWRGNLAAQCAGRYSRPCIVEFRDRPIGYLEIYRPAQDCIATVFDAHPDDLGLHAAITDQRFVRRGFGPRMLPRITARLFASDPRCERVIFDPDHRNTDVHRLCEYVGCEFLGEHELADRRIRLYAMPRSSAMS
ncbi:acetyltransferase [Nocardia sp. NBC_00508]|uniref:GNAT family N-acetyltransferase n=1 Tax=Nocardia sp. NBC_00508 TaxID=2975992 RepID=UPI002E801E3A|nr:GNAT family N-acetyltransferase [Nocardia sp. NBC_00508]WUD68705.1 acetyltransferase [Nocardia sp. NBC_00508]